MVKWKNGKMVKWYLYTSWIKYKNAYAAASTAKLADVDTRMRCINSPSKLNNVTEIAFDKYITRIKHNIQLTN